MVQNLYVSNKILVFKLILFPKYVSKLTKTFRKENAHISKSFAFENAQVKLVGENGQDQGSTNQKVSPGTTGRPVRNLINPSIPKTEFSI